MRLDSRGHLGLDSFQISRITRSLLILAEYALGGRSSSQLNDLERPSRVIYEPLAKCSRYPWPLGSIRRYCPPSESSAPNTSSAIGSESDDGDNRNACDCSAIRLSAGDIRASRIDGEALPAGVATITSTSAINPE